ncbi:uncharacterized protein BCR38DRAFT_476646 [Pseudomassariella vexata]|uniref:Xylanolytic transcriptional activator regulatory domain-containing protein n=1 Tax=Pseudomassariella vexata TaxID=1141098 RepID=A0A1Y2DNP4_9PEZI|nr:uncharacterized protein BCR38DRAFT_476646 [Pseudomassariella vexata]ORY60756.1 hypothetical protein BCR38DRAFT_476646 [Pseudomassariella vexata]
MRCDRQLPCKPCKRSRNALECRYSGGSQPLPSASVRSPQSNLHSISEAHDDFRGASMDSISLLQSEITEDNQAAQEHATEPEGDQNELLLDSHNPSPATLAYLSKRVASLEQTLSRMPNGKGVPPSSGTCILTPRAYLRVESEKTKLFGRSHWTHAFEQLSVLSKIKTKANLNMNGVHEDTAALIKEASSLRSSIVKEHLITVQDPIPNMAGSIPAKDVCDSVLGHYFRTFEPMFRILHRPSFMAEYNKFWRRQDSATYSFLLKLAMVLAIGGIFHQDKVLSDRLRKLAKSWVLAVQWWLLGPTEKAAMSLEGVQVFCLCLLARQTNALITVLMCLDSTLPLLISEEDFDCGLPSNLNDDDLEVDATTPPTARPQGEITDSSIQLLLQRSLISRLRVVRKLNGIKRLQSYEDTIRIGNDFKSYCREVAAFFQAQSSHAPLNAAFHRKFLDAYLRRYMLFIDRPFSLRARKDPRFFLARKTCLESCRIIASYAKPLNLQFETPDDFSRLSMWGSGLFKGPLSQDIIVTLGLEIYSQIEDEKLSIPTADHNDVASDPLLELSKASRRPLIDILTHILEQLRQTIALGRPSLKRYIMLSAILTQIQAVEKGNPEAQSEAWAAGMKATKECCKILRESGACGVEINPMTRLIDEFSPDEFSPDESVPDWSDALGSLGFDFDFLGPLMYSDLPNIPEPPVLGEGWDGSF